MNVLLLKRNQLTESMLKTYIDMFVYRVVFVQIRMHIVPNRLPMIVKSAWSPSFCKPIAFNQAPHNVRLTMIFDTFTYTCAHHRRIRRPSEHNSKLFLCVSIVSWGARKTHHKLLTRSNEPHENAHQILCDIYRTGTSDVPVWTRRAIPYLFKVFRLRFMPIVCLICCNVISFFVFYLQTIAFQLKPKTDNASKTRKIQKKNLDSLVEQFLSRVFRPTETASTKRSPAEMTRMTTRAFRCTHKQHTRTVLPHGQPTRE